MVADEEVQMRPNKDNTGACSPVAFLRQLGYRMTEIYLPNKRGLISSVLRSRSRRTLSLKKIIARGISDVHNPFGSPTYTQQCSTPHAENH